MIDLIGSAPIQNQANPQNLDQMNVQMLSDQCEVDQNQENSVTEIELRNGPWSATEHFKVIESIF